MAGSRPEVTIVPVTQISLEQRLLARVLAEAFTLDPYTIGLLPDGDPMRRLTRLFIRMVAESLRSRGEGYLAYAAGDPVGGALWQPPEAPLQWWTMVSGAPTYLRVFGTRLADALRTELRVLERQPRTPHWYLRAIGTVPGAQQQGIASALLRDRLQHVDAAGCSAYLEASTPRHVPFYGRFGFRSGGEIDTVGTVRCISMWRPADAPSLYAS